MTSILIQATHNEYLSYLNVTYRLYIGHYVTHVNVFNNKDFTDTGNACQPGEDKYGKVESDAHKRVEGHFMPDGGFGTLKAQRVLS